MRRYTPFIALLLSALAVGARPGGARQGAKIRALLLSSETGHPYHHTTPILCKTLLDAGMEVELSLTPETLKQANRMAGYDVVVFCGRHQARDEVAEKAIIDFVNGGKGLAAIHISSNSFLGSEEWKKLVGRIWGPGSGHPPYGPFGVKVTDGSHPIMRGISDFMVEDEMYQKLVVHPEEKMHVLATATDGQRTDPMAFTLEHGQGRVFHTTLGHGPVCHRTPVFQKLVVQGVEWAAKRR